MNQEHESYFDKHDFDFLYFMWKWWPPLYLFWMQLVPNIIELKNKTKETPKDVPIFGIIYLYRKISEGNNNTDTTTFFKCPEINWPQYSIITYVV